MAERKSSTQRKYRSETTTKNDAPPAENEIRIRRDGPTGGYINRAAELFLRVENPHRQVTISAIGQAIPIALAVSEKIREKIAGLHAVQSIQSIEKTIVFKPQEQGLDEITQTRFNAAFRIVLTLDASQQDIKSVGYSAPRQGVVTATLEEIKAFRPRTFNNNGNNSQDRPRYNNNNGNRGLDNRGERRPYRGGGDNRGGQYDNNGSRNYQNRNGGNGGNGGNRGGQTQRRGNPRQEKRYDGPSQSRQQ